METLIKTGRVAYSVGLLVMGVHQIYYGDFRPVLLPPWPSWRMNPQHLAYIVGIALVGAAFAIIFSEKGKRVSLALGTVFLALVIFWHLPYLFFIQPHEVKNLGLWTDALKALAWSGGAFTVAGSFDDDMAYRLKLMVLVEKVIPVGPIFFSVTMIAFGIDHFLYVDFVAPLVPAWIPGQIFWTYFAGVILIGSGVLIIFKIKVKLIATLLSMAIFLWFIILHIPRALADPVTANGNEIVSAADALAFSGIALIIAFRMSHHSRNTVM